MAYSLAAAFFRYWVYTLKITAVSNLDCIASLKLKSIRINHLDMLNIHDTNN